MGTVKLNEQQPNYLERPKTDPAQDMRAIPDRGPWPLTRPHDEAPALVCGGLSWGAAIYASAHGGFSPLRCAATGPPTGHTTATTSPPNSAEIRYTQIPVRPARKDDR